MVKTRLTTFAPRKIFCIFLTFSRCHWWMMNLDNMFSHPESSGRKYSNHHRFILIFSRIFSFAQFARKKIDSKSSRMTYNISLRKRVKSSHLIAFQVKEHAKRRRWRSFQEKTRVKLIFVRCLTSPHNKRAFCCFPSTINLHNLSVFGATLFHVFFYNYSRLFIATKRFFIIKQCKGQQATTIEFDLNAECFVNGIVIAYNRSIIVDGNLHTWFSLSPSFESNSRFFFELRSMI